MLRNPPKRLSSWCMLYLVCLTTATKGLVRAYPYFLPTGRRLSAATALYSEPRKTGWLHNSSSNQPKERPASASPPQPVIAAEGKSEHRTGWLHNTSPREEVRSQQRTTTTFAQQLLEQAKMKQERNHRIIAPPAFHTGSNNQVIAVTEHKISVPIYRNKKTELSSPQLMDLFFTMVEIRKDTDISWWSSLSQMTPTQRANSYVKKSSLTTADGILLYLQGGPGFGAPVPVVGLSLENSWATSALNHFTHIVLMDQRGTGRSTAITKQRLEKLFPNLFLLDDSDEREPLTDIDSFMMNVDEDDGNDDRKEIQDKYVQIKSALKDATDFMAEFRADNIVRDAEDIKQVLLTESKNSKRQDDDDGNVAVVSETVQPCPYGGVLGQSYGGFCIMTYLSQIPHPPRICLLTGGIAPMLTPIYQVYDSTWNRVRERNLKYYDMYPGDVAVIKTIVKALLENPPILPSGSKLTARRFLQIGISLGGSPSSFASLHRLVNNAFLEPDVDTTFNRAFLKAMDSEQSFDDHPIYFLMHESIYADHSGGTSPSTSTDWAAHRAYKDRVKTPSEWNYELTSSLNSDTRPTLMFGEMVFPWMAHGDYKELSGLGMRLLSESLAKKSDWGQLYDKNNMRRALNDGSISRAAAAVYYDDMYVDFDASMLVAKRGGPLEKCKVWVTNEYQHSGLRDNGAEIFNKLYGMAVGSIRTPS